MSLHRNTYTNCDSAAETCTDTEVAPHTAASPDTALKEIMTRVDEEIRETQTSLDLSKALK